MQLNFSNDYYKNIAFNTKHMDCHKPIDAFFLLIHDIKKEDLDNLCFMIQEYLLNNDEHINLTIDQCYTLTQNCLPELKNIIYNLALKCIKEKTYLGTNTINEGKINTSSWISHAINAGELCAIIAKSLNLDENKAKTLGLLHDYGRKYSHQFNHLIVGYEKLIDIGWNEEAIGCLTHSFIKGGKCANNEPAIQGFYVNEFGNPCWEKNIIKDDITYFLELYQYTPYDYILNIADLMATDREITSPHKRIADIATRRQIDPKNRGYFIAEFTNLLIDTLKNINNTNLEVKHIKADKNITIDAILKYFNYISQEFYQTYQELTNNHTKSISL